MVPRTTVGSRRSRIVLALVVTGLFAHGKGAAQTAAPIYDVSQFTSVQAAYDSCPEGARLYFPHGRRWKTPVGGLVIGKGIEIFGEGLGTQGADTLKGSWVSPADDTSAIFIIQDVHDSSDNTEVGDVYIHDLQLGYGFAEELHSNKPGVWAHITAGKVISNLRFERLIIRQMSEGIFLDGAGASINFITIKDCQATKDSTGFHLKNCADSYLLGSYAGSCQKWGMFLDDVAGPRLIGCSLGNNWTTRGINYDFEPQVYLRGCATPYVHACSIENFAQETPLTSKTAITLENCLGGEVTGNWFSNNAPEDSSRGILLASSSRGNVIGPNLYARTHVPVQIRGGTDGNTGNVVMPQAIHTLQDYSGKADAVVIPDQVITKATALTSAANPSTYYSVYPRYNVGVGSQVFPRQFASGVLLPRIEDAVVQDTSLGRQAGLLLYNDDEGSTDIYDGQQFRQLTSRMGLRDSTGVTVSGTTGAIPWLANLAAGLYRVSIYAKVTTASTFTSDNLDVGFTWDDGTAGQTKSSVFTMSLNLKTLNSFQYGEAIIYVAATKNITYTRTRNKTGSGSNGLITFRLRAEKI